MSSSIRGLKVTDKGSGSFGVTLEGIACALVDIGYICNAGVFGTKEWAKAAKSIRELRRRGWTIVTEKHDRNTLYRFVALPVYVGLL